MTFQVISSHMSVCLSPILPTHTLALSSCCQAHPCDLLVPPRPGTRPVGTLSSEIYPHPHARPFPAPGLGPGQHSWKAQRRPLSGETFPQGCYGWNWDKREGPTHSPTDAATKLDTG